MTKTGLKPGLVLSLKWAVSGLKDPRITQGLNLGWELPRTTAQTTITDKKYIKHDSISIVEGNSPSMSV